MKILRLTTFLDFGGQEMQYISVGNAKCKLKMDYVFAAIGKGGYASEKLRDQGFTVKVFDRNPSAGNLSIIFILYRWFRQLRPDIVHTAAAEANFHGVLAARLAGVKVVVAEEIGFPRHSKKARLVFSLLYRWVDRVICVSHAVRSFLVELGEIPMEKGVVIYNPVRPLRHFPSDPQPYFTLVSVGRLEHVKNQRMLLRAVAALKDKQVRLILVGEGSERSGLEQEIEVLGLAGRVLISGFVPDPERYLAKASLFVLPSLSEGFGIAAVEAMHAGVPCLCSGVGGIPEFITEGESGWLFNPTRLEELVSKLEYLLAMDTEKLKTVGLRGQESVKNRFSENIYVAQLESFYRQMVKR